MCGRFALVALGLDEAFHEFSFPPNRMPRYNIAPSTPVLVVPNDGSSAACEMTWGLLPSWSTASKPLINARAETIAEKPSFRSSFKKHRCLVFASGFYEWQRTAAVKQPFYFSIRDGRPFAFAGIYTEADDGAAVAIITTSPNALMAPVHDRMPVILRRDAYAQWLEPGEADSKALAALLVPAPATVMRAWPVSTAVNSVRHDGPALAEAITASAAE